MFGRIRLHSGKSQLLNLMTKTKVAAVSRKRHTTREGIMGSRMINSSTQLLFVDTPGFLRTGDAKKEGLERSVMTTAKREIGDVDYTLIVVDAAMALTDSVKATISELMMKATSSTGRKESLELPNDEKENSMEEESGAKDEGGTTEHEEVVEENEQQPPKQKFAVVLNKVDLVHPKSLLLKSAMELGDMAEQCLQSRGQTDPTEAPVPLNPDILMEVMPTFFYTNCRKNEGVDDIVDFLEQKATPCQEFEKDVTPEPEEQAAEIIREKLYRCLHKEVPYHIRQINRLFRVTKHDGKLGLVIAQDLIVQSKSHLQLVQGRTLQVIRETAERDMISSFRCPVDLQITVKLAKSSQRTWSI